jgi:hypothetical protein
MVRFRLRVLHWKMVAHAWLVDAWQEICLWFAVDEEEQLVWHKKPLSIAALYGFVGLLWYWELFIPSPGKTVAALGVVAAAMSLRGEMRGKEKLAWMIMLFALLLLELTSIDEERLANENLRVATRQQEADSFQSIAQGITRSVELSQRQFEATIGTTNHILSNITGGQSYAVVVPILGAYRPDRPVPLAIESHGTNILTGVSVTIYESGVWIEATHESLLRSIANRINVGTLHPGERLVLGSQLIPAALMKVNDPPPTSYRAFVYITAQNFSSEEYLDFQPKVNGGWKFKYLLERQVFDPKRKEPAHPKRRPGILEETDWSDNANDLKFKQP